MKTKLFTAALILMMLHSHAPGQQAEVRTFTSATGTVIKGELDTIQGDMVTIKPAGGGAPITTKAANFSPADLAFLRGNGLRDVNIATEPSLAAADKPFINSIGMQFVPVPGTQILFCTHITRRQDYGAYANASGGMTVNPTWRNYPQDDKGQPYARENDYPVVGVNWDDAKGFCNWLGQKEGRTYRMPTDREWSFAAGIGKAEEAEKDNAPEKLNSKVKDVYPWGTRYPPPPGSGNFADTSHVEMFPTWTENGKTVKIKGIPGYTDGYPMTSPVFAFKPNQLGIFDMSGNIGQWCEGWFDEKQTRRLHRGCAYNAGGKEALSCSWRMGFPQDLRLVHNIGFTSFRCVVELPK